MRSFCLSELVPPLAGSQLGADASFSGVTTDSRAVSEGQLFVALKGERFDGHRFVASAGSAGASAALVSEAVDADLPLLQVADTQVALGQLAALNRSGFTGTLVGITGSCGKTSVRNLLESIFSRVAPTLATYGNLNNEIGMPLTLLELNPEHRYAVVEMGAGKPGDIAYLCQLAQPGISLLLNALPAHLETMGTVEDIAHTKGEILSGLGGRGTAIFPVDSEYTGLWRELAGTADCRTFGFSDAADVYATHIEVGGEGSLFTLHADGDSEVISLSLPGRHNVANALAAAAGALAAGVSLSQVAGGLAAATPVGGRLRQHQLPGGVTLIDDAYNANPASVRAAIDVLETITGRRILVLGAMAELGALSEAMHAEVGRYAAGHGIDALWATGDFCDAAVAAFGEGGRLFENREELTAALKSLLAADDVVLVKGSRSAGMDAVVRALIEMGET